MDANNFDTLELIQCKIDAGEPISAEEQEMLHQWLSKDQVRQYQFITLEKIALYLKILERTPSWETFFDPNKIIRATNTE